MVYLRALVCLYERNLGNKSPLWAGFHNPYFIIQLPLKCLVLTRVRDSHSSNSFLPVYMGTLQFGMRGLVHSSP